MRRFYSVLGALLLSVALVAPATAAPGKSGAHAKKYYLSLGDSLAASVQPIGVQPHNFGPRTATQSNSSPSPEKSTKACPGQARLSGRDDDDDGRRGDLHLRPRLATRRGGGVPCGPSTVRRLHHDRRRRERLCSPNCPASLTASPRSKPTSPRSLRTAGRRRTRHPDRLDDPYNPFLGAWLTGPDGQEFAEFSTFSGIVPINGLLRGIYTHAGASVADVEGAFSPRTLIRSSPCRESGAYRSTWLGSVCGRGSARPHRLAPTTTPTLPVTG